VAAIAADVEFAIVQFPLLDGPTPSPRGPVAAGDTAVSVIATLPAVATENVKATEPFGATVPLNVSVVGVFVEGELGLPSKSLSGLAQADMMSTDAGIRSDRKRRGIFMLALIGSRAQAD
jgi:hypothetical protein